MSLSRILAGAALLFVFAVPGLEAQEAAPSPLSIQVENLSARSEERAADNERVALGDTLQYTLKFTNHQGKGIRNVQIVNPVAPSTQIVPGSVSADTEARVEYSIDGGQSFSERPMVVVIEDGVEVEKPAAPQSYTHIRWTILSRLEAGEVATASFRTRFAH